MTYPLRLVTDPRRCGTTLVSGEAKRLPTDLTKPALNYYVACPACGMLNVVPVAGTPRAVIEDGGLVSMSPGFVCWGDSCKRRIEIVGGAFEVADAAAA